MDDNLLPVVLEDINFGVPSMNLSPDMFLDVKSHPIEHPEPMEQLSQVPLVV